MYLASKRERFVSVAEDSSRLYEELKLTASSLFDTEVFDKDGWMKGFHHAVGRLLKQESIDCHLNLSSVSF